MMFIILSILASILLYFIIKFVIKPYRRMRSYAKYQAAVILPFVPVAGAFKFTQDAYSTTGDENYDAKRVWQKYSVCKLFVFNALDKCFVSLNDPSLIQQFFQKQEHFVKEEAFLQNRTRLFGKGVAFAEGHEWSKRRKILSSLFHFSYFNNFIAVILNIVDRQINNLLLNKNRTFEAKHTAQQIAGDAVVKTFFGVSFNQKIEDQSMSVWLSKLIEDNVTQQRSLRYFTFGLPILKLGLFAEDRSMNNRIAQFRAAAKNAIESKLNSNDIKGTMLEAIKEKGLLETDQGYKISEVIEEFMGFFVAGVDTTSHLLTMSFYYLSLYPEWQEKLRKEISESKILDHLEFKEISNLKYVQYFLKEVFRHYSYMISVFPRRCLKTIQIGQFIINEGDIVVPGWLYLNYNPEYFPNPHTFDPSRWQTFDQKLNPYIFTPFSIGSRGCLGQNFALLQTKIVLIKYINTFYMKLKDGYELKLKTSSLYGPVNPMIIEIESIK